MQSNNIMTAYPQFFFLTIKPSLERVTKESLRIPALNLPLSKRANGIIPSVKSIKSIW